MLADMRLTTAQQRSTGQILPSDLFVLTSEGPGRQGVTVGRNGY
jgi:hypothetical protein